MLIKFRKFWREHFRFYSKSSFIIITVVYTYYDKAVKIYLRFIYLYDNVGIISVFVEDYETAVDVSKH